MKDITGSFVLQERDGDYVWKVESTGLETVKLHFTFTKDFEKARRFDYLDLFSPLATVAIGMEFLHGFSGGRVIKI